MQNMTLIKNSRRGYLRQSTNTKHTRKCLTSLTKVIFANFLSSLFSFFYRISIGFKPEICPNLFWHNFIYEDNKIQVNNIWRQVVSHRRNYGTSHWVLHHQWSGDYVFWNQDHPQNTQKQHEEIILTLPQNIFINSACFFLLFIFSCFLIYVNWIITRQP